MTPDEEEREIAAGARRAALVDEWLGWLRAVELARRAGTRPRMWFCFLVAGMHLAAALGHPTYEAVGRDPAAVPRRQGERA